MPNRGVSLVGALLILVGVIFLAAGLGLSFQPLTVVTFKGPMGTEAQIVGISMPVATALWIGVVLIILGIVCLYLSGKD